MVVVKARGEPLRNHKVPIAIVAGCPLLVWLMLNGNGLLLLAVLGLIATTVGIYVGLRHPLWLYWGLAIMVGALPFGYFPGVHVPLYLPFAGGAVLAAIIHPSEEGRTKLHPVEVAVLLLIGTSAISLLATGRNLTDFGEFTKWVIATGAVLALLRLSRENMAKFGRIYVYAASFNALCGILIVPDPAQRLYRLFRPFGYGIGYGREDLARYFFSAGSRSVRLGGLWVDPNAAGIGLLVALVLCVLLLRGNLRFWLGALLAIALVLTLSRAAIFSVLAGLVLVLLFHGMRAKYRQILVGVLVTIAAACLLVPFIRLRIVSSLGQQDSGGVARGEALRDFPGTMTGNWWFGLGWGGKEFKNGAFSYITNIVANAPLLTVHRGGIFAGLMFVLVLIVGFRIAYRCMRSNSVPVAIYGGVFIGFGVIALQLDHPVVGIPQTTIAYSILLAFLVYADQSRSEVPDSSRDPQRHARPPSGQGPPPRGMVGPSSKTDLEHSSSAALSD